MMKIKLLLLMLVLFSLGIRAQNISFTDAKFKEAILIADTSNEIAKDLLGNPMKIDSNNDGEIQINEAEQVGYLNLYGYTTGIHSFQDVLAFTNIEDLRIYIYDNPTTSLKINGLTKLKYLKCAAGFSLDSIIVKDCPALEDLFVGGNTVLTFLDIQNLPQLSTLTIDGNNVLKTLNIQNFPKLKSFLCNSNSGLENFTFVNCPLVEHIIFQFNKLPNVNFSNLSNLKTLKCSSSLAMTTLDVSNCKNLEELYCVDGALTSLNVLGCENLKFLYCAWNRLASLDISGLSKLEILNCSDNQITALNLSEKPNLQYVDCKNNRLTSINLDGLNMTSTQLPDNNVMNLECSGNLLTEIDLSKAKIRMSNFSNNRLNKVFIKNGFNDQAYLIDNPNIKYICSDENEISSYQNFMIEYGVTNCSVNSYCSFTPGKSFNTITGTAKIDSNNNGCDPTDDPFEYLKLKIDDGTNSGETFVQNDGKYQFYTQAGQFNVTTTAENPTLFTVSPANFSTSFADANNNVFIQDICVTANGVQNDAEVMIAPLTNARPGFDTVYNLVWRNKGNTTLSGKVILNYDSNKMVFQSSSLPYTIISTGSIEFDYTNLKPLANTASEITFKINTPTDSVNPVNMGDVLAFNAQITPSNTDITPDDNLFSLNHTVVNSFDPNDIVCLEGENVPVSSVGKYLHYIINFENTGNAEAENIVVKMEVDPNEFDINTLQLQNSSASVDTKIIGNKVEFIFKKIKLQSGGHGNVLLKMRSKSDLVEGDTVNNVAEIYFDYNFPIETNDYVTTIYSASNVLSAKINYSASNFSQNNYPVKFDASLSTGNITTYQWEFSGNPSISSSTDVAPTVTYTVPGNYTAKLTVFDSDNNSSSKTITFNVGGNVADLSTGKDSENNFIAIDADEDDWKGYDINGAEITPKVRHTYTGWSYADISNGVNSQWITLNNLEGYYTYKSREFTVPDNATDAKLNLRSLSFVRNWTYLVRVNPDGSETETEITKTQWMNDGFKGWLNSRSPKVENYNLSPGRYYIKVFLYSNNSLLRQSIDVNAVVSCSSGLMYSNRLVQKQPTLGVEDYLNSEIKLYPIPTKGLINIISDEKIKTVEVYDSLGRVIQTQIHNAKEIKLNTDLPKGIYYLKIKTDKATSVKKIIKE